MLRTVGMTVSSHRTGTVFKADRKWVTKERMGLVKPLLQEADALQPEPEA